ncbi:hypothetical protein BB561_002517, partial [Smittium simulii]
SFFENVGYLIATQGVLFGLGNGLIYSTSMAVTSQWFETKRGLALGIITSGCGCGGLVISRIVNAAIVNLGYQWSLRITSIMYFTIIFVAALAFKPRFQVTYKPKLVDITAFKGPVFLSVIACGFIGNLGYVVPIFFIPSEIINLGGSDSFASNQVTFFNVGFLVGGFAIGYLSDIIGPLNAFAISTFFAGAFQLIFWVAFKSLASLTVTSFFYGFFVPGFISQCVSAITRNYPSDKWASYSGTYFAAAGISVVVSNSFIDKLLGSSLGSPNYVRAAAFSGICYVIASLAIIPSIFYLRHKAGANKT